MKHIYTTIVCTILFITMAKSQVKFDAYITTDIETVKFINLTEHNTSDPYMLFYWKLGDGVEMFAGKELNHNYEAPGLYEIILVGVTKSGIRDTFIQSYNIPEDLIPITEEREKEKKKIAQALFNLKKQDLNGKF